MAERTNPDPDRPITGMEVMYADQCATKSLLLAALEVLLEGDAKRAEKGAKMAEIGAAVVDRANIPSGPSCNPDNVRRLATAEVRRLAQALGRPPQPRRR
jgi:hypothetical protein